MDDIRPPRRPITPTTPGTDIAGVPPRRPMPAMPVASPPKVDEQATPPTHDPIKVSIQDHDKPSVIDAPTLDDLKLDTPSDIDAAIEGRPAAPQELPVPPAAEPMPAPFEAPVAEDTVPEEPLDLPSTNDQNAGPSSSLLAEIEAQEKSSDEGKVTNAPTTQPPRKGRGPAIIIAVILALALVGGAGYAYWQNNKQSPKTPAVTIKKTTVEKTKNPAKATDVDTAAKEIQAAIDKIDETKQYQETDLSDATLGLQ